MDGEEISGWHLWSWEGLKHTKQTKMEVKQKGEKRKCFWTLHLPSEKQRKSSVLEWIRKSSIWKNVSSSLYAEPAGFPTWATMCCQAECWSLEWLWLILFSIFTFFCSDLTLNFFLCFSGYSHLPKGTIYGKSAVLLDSLLASHGLLTQFRLQFINPFLLFLDWAKSIANSDYLLIKFQLYSNNIWLNFL